MLQVNKRTRDISIFFRNLNVIREKSFESFKRLPLEIEG